MGGPMFSPYLTLSDGTTGAHTGGPGDSAFRSVALNPRQSSLGQSVSSPQCPTPPSVLDDVQSLHCAQAFVVSELEPSAPLDSETVYSHLRHTPWSFSQDTAYTNSMIDHGRWFICFDLSFIGPTVRAAGWSLHGVHAAGSSIQA